MCGSCPSFIALIGCLLPFLSGATPEVPSFVSSEGGISLSQTRVVFISTDRAQILTIKNSGPRSWLIQSRVQQGLDNALNAPFIVTPPLFTLQPHSQQLLRIVSLGGRMPTDRESLFTLSLLAIPAAESQSIVSNALGKVSLGIRFTLKLFYRPAGLVDGIEAATCRLRMISTSEGIRVENPTPYFQTLGDLTLNGVPVKLTEQPSMLSPFGSHSYSLHTSGAIQTEWQTVTDYGGLSTRCKQLK